jgi:hypothetical protein
VQEWKQHQVVQDLLFAVTGLPGVHVVGDVAKATVSIESIRRCLGYPVEIRGPRGGKLRRKKKESVSPEVVEKLNKIKNCLRMYLPDFHIEPYDDKVTMKRCACTLDAVLSKFYGCSFKKDGTDTYVLRRLALFDETSPVKQLPWAWGVLGFHGQSAEETEEHAHALIEFRARASIAIKRCRPLAPGRFRMSDRQFQEFQYCKSK